MHSKIFVCTSFNEFYSSFILIALKNIRFHYLKRFLLRCFYDCTQKYPFELVISDFTLLSLLLHSFYSFALVLWSFTHFFVALKKIRLHLFKRVLLIIYFDCTQKYSFALYKTSFTSLLLWLHSKVFIWTCNIGFYSIIFIFALIIFICTCFNEFYSSFILIALKNIRLHLFKHVLLIIYFGCTQKYSFALVITSFTNYFFECTQIYPFAHVKISLTSLLLWLHS